MQLLLAISERTEQAETVTFSCRHTSSGTVLRDIEFRLSLGSNNRIYFERLGDQPRFLRSDGRLLMETADLYQKAFSVGPAPQQFERLVESTLIDGIRDDDLFVRVLRLLYRFPAQQFLEASQLKYQGEKEGIHTIDISHDPRASGQPFAPIKWNSLPRDPVDWRINVSSGGRLVSIETNSQSVSPIRQRLVFSEWRYDDPDTEKDFVHVLPEDRDLVDFIDYQPTPYPEIGSRLRDFPFRNLDRSITSLYSHRREERPAVVFFWKRIESGDQMLDELNSIQQEMGEEVDFLAVNVDSDEPDELRTYIEENGLSLMIGSDINQDLQYRSEFAPFPATIVVDANNTIQYTRFGVGNAYFLSQGPRRPEYGTEIRSVLSDLLSGKDLAELHQEERRATEAKLRDRLQELEQELATASPLVAVNSYHQEFETVDQRIVEWVGKPLESLVPQWQQTSADQVPPFRKPRVILFCEEEGAEADAGFESLRSAFGNQWLDFQVYRASAKGRDRLLVIVDRSGVIQSARKFGTQQASEDVIKDLKSLMLGADLVEWQ